MTMSIQQRISSTKGFTLAEATLVVAIIAILISISASDVMGYLQLQKNKEEELILQDFKEAIEVVIKREGVVPATTVMSDMIAVLDDTTSRSMTDFSLDVWDQPRYIKVVETLVTYRNAQLPIQYGVIYSFGGDGCPGLDMSCSQTDRNEVVADLLSTAGVDDPTEFDSLQARDGDFLIKFSNKDEQLERYKTTTERLTRLSEALEVYSRLWQNDAIANDVDDNLLFRPPSTLPGNGSSNSYYSPMRAEVATALTDVGISGGLVRNTGTTDADHGNRRQSMIALTKLLGLPPSYCCTPLAHYDDPVTGKAEELPFYYYSNPGRLNRSTGVCSYNTTGDTAFPPARIRVERLSSADCPGTN